MGLDPGVVGDRCVLHLLAVLLTLTPHARFHSTLLRAYTHFLLTSQAYFTFSSPSLAFFRFRFFFLERTSIHFISVGRLRGHSPPQAHPAPLAYGYHDDPCALKKGGRRSL